MAHWFTYFPDNFMWSQGMMIAIEMARFGAGALGEVDQVGRRLSDRVGDNDAWGKEWLAMAREHERRAAAADAEGHRLTAGTHYLHAMTYYFVADRFVAPGERKSMLYQSCLRCFAAGVERRHPNVERVEVPYLDATLPAWFMRAPGDGRRRAVVCFDGLDSCKEMSALFAGIELARRGISLLAIDGPGQGEALRLRGIPSRYDYEVPAAAAYDCVAGRADVDPKRVAIMAFSMGGYYAPRAAAFEQRYAACVAWGAHFDYHANWVGRRKVLESGGTRVSAPHFQLPWVMGVTDMDAAMERLKPYTLAGVADKITCPMLITHGENDGLSPVSNARLLYDTVSSKVKTLKIFTTEEGGSEHCQGDNRMLGANYVADWLADHL